MGLDKTYIAQQGQSVYDLVMQTYGDMNQLYKLVQDNGIENVDEVGLQSKKILFDSSLVSDKSVFNRNDVEEIIYVTAVSVGASGGLLTDDGDPITTDDGEFIVISG